MADRRRMHKRTTNSWEGQEVEHGMHTLRVHRGTIVGMDGDDVFVELGPRMQGVISLREFDAPPAVDDEFEFTLRGQEEGLWALSLRPTASFDRWEQMEAGYQVEGRIVRRKPGGYEVKLGVLHAFMPQSHSGVARDGDPESILGKILNCEVLEVDVERERVLVSRKLVLQRERMGDRGREISGLHVGQKVQGRVTRIEDYGVFLSFGRGLEGLIHVSNLSHERVQHPSEVVQKGEHLQVVVLYVKHGGKRIGLGLKQVGLNPWREFERAHKVGALVGGEVCDLREFGVFVRTAPGVIGLLHRSETQLQPEDSVHKAFAVGQPLVLRILDLDPAAERMSLSAKHPAGAPIRPEELEAAGSVRELLDGQSEASTTGKLGSLLRKALEKDNDALGA